MYFIIYFILGYLVSVGCLSFFLKPDLNDSDDTAWSMFISLVIVCFWPIFLLIALIYLPYYLVDKKKYSKYRKL